MTARSDRHPRTGNLRLLVTMPGAVYRTHFKVQPDGRVSDAASESGDGCVQQALRDWVKTFSYAPIRETIPVAFDWMVVTAARGN